MHKSDVKSKLIEILSETPFIGYACKKVGIARATFYRWMKDNLEFKKQIEKALKDGRESMCEIAESMVLKKGREGDLRANIFILQNNDKRYTPKRSIFVEPPKTKIALKPYEICENCGNSPMPPEQVEQILKAFKNAKGDKYSNDKD